MKRGCPMSDSQKYLCPKCNGLVDYGTKFCPHCGNALNFSATASENEQNSVSSNLITEAEFQFSKLRLMHMLLSTVSFKGTKVEVRQKNKWLPFVKTDAGFAQFDIMDIESVYLKKSYNVKMCILLVLCLFATFTAGGLLLLAISIFVAFSLRETALIIKYIGGYLKLFSDKSIGNDEKQDDPQLLLDYIKQYNPDCVHVLMD